VIAVDVKLTLERFTTEFLAAIHAKVASGMQKTWRSPWLRRQMEDVFVIHSPCFELWLKILSVVSI
jgi:hypothetical protein